VATGDPPPLWYPWPYGPGTQPPDPTWLPRAIEEIIKRLDAIEKKLRIRPTAAMKAIKAKEKRR
jgi:hypothetical protein